MSEEGADSPPPPATGGTEEEGDQAKEEREESAGEETENEDDSSPEGSISSKYENQEEERTSQTGSLPKSGELYEVMGSEKAGTEDRASIGSQSLIKEIGEFEQLFQGEYNPLDEHNDEELVKVVEDMQNEMRHLRMENLIFLHFLQKNDPSMVEDMENVLKTVQAVKDRVSQTLQRRSLTHSSTQSSLLHSTSTFGSSLTLGIEKAGPKINLTQRTDLLLREMEEIQTNLETLESKSHTTKCQLRAELEEMSIRESELTEAMDVFENAIVIGGMDPIAQKIPVDKFIRYMEEWLKSARLTIDKIRLRTSSFKVQYHKVCRQLFEKRELGVNLTEVDFDQLLIENKNLKEKIEVKTQLLIEMKRMSGTANLNLTIHKKLLQKKIDEVNRIKEAIKTKEDRIVKLDSDCDTVNEELEEAKENYFAVKDRVESYTVPEVIDYVKAKAEVSVLKKNIKVWVRRKNIKEMALGACIQEMKGITSSATVKPSWLVMPQDSVSSSTESFHFNFEVKQMMKKNTRMKRINPKLKNKLLNQ